MMVRICLLSWGYGVVLVNTDEAGTLFVTNFRLLFLSEGSRNIIALGTIPLATVEKFNKIGPLGPPVQCTCNHQHTVIAVLVYSGDTIDTVAFMVEVVDSRGVWLHWFTDEKAMKFPSVPRQSERAPSRRLLQIIGDGTESDVCKGGGNVFGCFKVFNGLRGSLVMNGDFELELAVVTKKKWFGSVGGMYKGGEGGAEDARCSGSLSCTCCSDNDKAGCGKSLLGEMKVVSLVEANGSDTGRHQYNGVLSGGRMFSIALVRWWWMLMNSGIVVEMTDGFKFGLERVAKLRKKKIVCFRGGNPFTLGLRRAVFDALLRCTRPARLWDLYAFTSGPSKFGNTNPMVRSAPGFHVSWTVSVARNFMVSSRKRSCSCTVIPTISWTHDEYEEMQDLEKMPWQMEQWGGGSESSSHYFQSEIVFFGIDNIHAMRDSLSRLRDYLDTYGATSSDGMSSFLRHGGWTWGGGNLSSMSASVSTLGDSGWLIHVQNVLAGSAWIAARVALESASVLIHCR
ncbi:myotubularin-like phosphatases II superfamily [Actinidia rufa]|uniref:Myotubularin-like phosphatases II superfamily n=1 Tax=Actinidia rufa TaxID=165716 RepID=A0A7J0GK50_9ERIC|nr:myotubularin-like phosphatases II superfamily [Actinidia rufa]